MLQIPIPAARTRTAQAWPLPGGRLPGLALATLLASACGGGGGEGAPTTAAAPAATAAATASDASARRLALAEKTYLGSPRVPDGFRLDAPPVGATGPVATVHLKNSDLPGAVAGAPRWELCSVDVAEALGWSELRASWQGAYADLVESNSTATAFEFVRVPRNDASARLRHRVFRCDYVERDGGDLDAASGPAGSLKGLPVTVGALQQLAEYLWQFTAHNNADHVVLSSAAGSAGAGQVAWRIEMAHLVRAGAANDCDRIERVEWTHVADVASGALTRRTTVLEEFRARRVDGVAQLCGG